MDRNRPDSGLHGQNTFYDLLIRSKSEDVHAALDGSLLVDDTLNFIAAGMDTTSHTLGYATYYILSDSEVKTKLLRELDNVVPYVRNFDYRRVQRLPYLVCKNLSMKYGG